jgi:hypothetical protein
LAPGVAARRASAAVPANVFTESHTNVLLNNTGYQVYGTTLTYACRE